MKYRQLTKEQFEELHLEFAKFLATQQIDAEEWKEMKAKNPDLAEDEMNLFSDVVWDDVLSKINYLEHFSENTINLFRCDAEEIHRIVVKVDKEGINLMESKDDYQWFVNNSKDDAIEYFKGQKPYLKERNSEIFDLIEKGSAIAKGELYEAVFKLIGPS